MELVGRGATVELGVQGGQRRVCVVAEHQLVTPDLLGRQVAMGMTVKEATLVP